MKSEKNLKSKKVCNGFTKINLLALALTFVAYPIQAEESSYKPLRGLCYDASTNYSEANIRRDLSIIKSLAPKIKTTSNEGILYRVPEFCKDLGLYCYPGAYIDNVAGDDVQVSNLVAIANSGYVEGDDTQSANKIKGLVVGNGFLKREEQRGHDLSASKARLINYINQVKANTILPVTTSESWQIWNYDNSTDLASAVDFIMINVDPKKDNIQLGNAAQYVVDRLYQIQQKYPGKNIIIGETGWPATNGISGENDQKIFLEDFTGLAKENNIDYLISKAFDKSGDGNGVLYEDRTLKSASKSLVQPKIAGFDRTKIKFWTFDGNNYPIEGCDSLDKPRWTNIINAVGRAGTNMTEVILPSQGASRYFYRVNIRI